MRALRCRRPAKIPVLPLLALSVALLLSSPSRPGLASSSSNWRFGLVDDWGRPVSAARAYLYNSTGAADYASWRLLGTGAADSSGNATIVGLGASWNSSGVPGLDLEYRLVVKMEINGSASPITLGNYTVLSRPYAPARGLAQLGGMLNGSAAYTFGPYGLSPNQWGRFRLGLFYIALKAVDERGYPLPCTEVYVSFSSQHALGPSGGTLITTKVVPPWANAAFPFESAMWGQPLTNGSCGSEFMSLHPPSPNTGPTELGGVGWIVIRIPRIGPTSGADSSLVNNLSFLLKYRGTVVGNFTADRWLDPMGGAWVPGAGIDGRLDPANRARTLNAELQGNATQVIVCSVRWAYANLLDQNHNGWPTRNAKLILYDQGLGSPYPWTCPLVPTDPFTSPDFNPSRALIRYPSVNTSVEVVVSWYDITVNVTLFRSALGQPGGMLMPGRPGTPDLTNPSNSDPDGVGNFNIYSDMVRIRLKLFSSGQLPAPLDPDEVDEIDFLLRGRTATAPGYEAKLSYWHGYVAIPDSPLAWLLGSTALLPPGVDEATAATGWLPNGSRSLVDIIVRYEGSEVLDTRRASPLNSTIVLRCPGFVNGLPVVDPARTDYDRTLLLYAGIYDVGFKVLLGSARYNSSAPDVPLFVTFPGGQRRALWTDGGGVATLRDVPAGNYSGFVILYKMRPIAACNVGPAGIRVAGNARRMYELLFPAFEIDLTIWNYDRTFRLANVNVSLCSSVNLSQYAITDDLLNQVLSSPRGNVLPEGWSILGRLPSGRAGAPVVLYRTSSWSTNSTWPLRIRLMPTANYSLRVSVPSGSGARRAGFRDADANATLYWSDDAWGQRIALDGSTLMDIRTYVYDARMTALDASGVPLGLFEDSAIILAEPYPHGGNVSLWQLQQKNSSSADYDAYLVRFNLSAANVFHSVNASSSGLNDSDIALMNPATHYPQQSRYLIGAGNLSSPSYRFMIYYRGVLVFNGSLALSNPYLSEENRIVTSVYSYTFRALNNPQGNNSFAIPNLRVEIRWAGLRTSYWPTVNLTRGEAIDEFALLNATKLQYDFDVSVVERMWGPPPSNESVALLPNALISPYFSSYVAVEGGVTDANGEVQAMIPIWNDSVRIFGTPIYVDVRTVPGHTVGVPYKAGSTVVGSLAPPRSDLGDPPWSGQYPLWQGINGANLTGLVDRASAAALGFSKSNGTGLLPHGIPQSPLILRVAANDLTLIVKDASGNALPHQRVDIISDDLSLHLTFFTGSGTLSLPANRSFIFWGSYSYTIATTNLTDSALVEEWELSGLQTLVQYLEPMWSSQVLVFQWPAQLTVQVTAGDGSTPLERAWVLVSYGTDVMIDGNSGSFQNVMPGTNVTASLTDAHGLAGGAVPMGNGMMPLSLNLFRGTYLLRIYYSLRGSPDIMGPIKGLLVYDSFTDEPQHRYVYLGVEPPDSSGVDWSPAQFWIARTSVWSLRVRLVSQSGRPVAGARVRIAQFDQWYDLDPLSDGICSTTQEGNAWLSLVPAGSFALKAEWRSAFSSKPTEILSTSVAIAHGGAELTLRTEVYDLELKLVDQNGDAIPGASVSISLLDGGTVAEVGMTDAKGTVSAFSVPEGKYHVRALWYGVDVSPETPLSVYASRGYVLTARDVGRLMVQVIGALGQGLATSEVEVLKEGLPLLSAKADAQGYVSALLPFGEYSVRARHGGLEALRPVTLNAPSVALQVQMGEFTILLGMGMTPIAAIICLILCAVLFLAIAILINEYAIWRRKRLPQLFR